jgi:hypothetical protein
MQELGRGGIISMQYADDTLLFLENRLLSSINLKWILACFERMSGMRINFYKCDLVPINVMESDAQLIAQSLSCKMGDFPLKYLGVPLHHSKLKKRIYNLLLIRSSRELLVGERSSLTMLLS